MKFQREYTKEELEASIRECREFKDMLGTREEYLILLHNAALDCGGPVDANGHPLKKQKKERKPVPTYLKDVMERIGHSRFKRQMSL